MPKYRVTLEYVVTVDADDEDEAQEMAEEEVFDYSPDSVEVEDLDDQETEDDDLEDDEEESDTEDLDL